MVRGLEETGEALRKTECSAKDSRALGPSLKTKFVPACDHYWSALRFAGFLKATARFLARAMKFSAAGLRLLARYVSVIGACTPGASSSLALRQLRNSHRLTAPRTRCNRIERHRDIDRLARR